MTLFPYTTLFRSGNDIIAAPASADDATKLGNYLKNFTSGVFSSTVKLVDADGAGAGNLIYFPFAATDGQAALRIYDSNGNLRYSESATVTAGVKIFRFDFLNAPGGWLGTVGLSAGTYSYEISVDNVTATSGTFTLIAK